MSRNWLLFSGVTAAAALVACGGGGGATPGTDGSGTAMSATDTMTSNDTTAGMTGSMTTNPMSTTTNADTTAGSESSGSETDTGVPACPYTPVDGMPSVSLELVANGWDRPVLAIGDPQVPDRLFVVEQGGSIKILEPGQASAPDDSFLQLDVPCAGNNTIGCEQGLLGFAFHPDFPTDPRVYVSYTAAAGQTRVSEFRLAEGDANHADPASERIVIEGAQPFGNHNGGMIAFGQDGYLYVGLGDGGSSDDQPQQTGRDPGVILAKMLRIGVEPDGTPDNPVACSPQYCDMLGPYDYTIPADNPFVDDPDFAPETYAWGFRNPWRFSFDVMTGDLYVGDVGQGDWEEVDLVVAGGDYGWSVMEGNHCFDGPCETTATLGETNSDGITTPIAEYSHNEGCSITGGAVYRSCEVPGWEGVYTYADYCSGRMYGLVKGQDEVTQLGMLLDTGNLVLGTGWNAWGDVYVTTLETVPGGPIGDGFVYRLAPG